MQLKRNHIKDFLLLSGVIIGAIVLISFAFFPEFFKALETLLVSCGATFSVFGRQFISEKIGDFLNLDKTDEEIEKLKVVDDEIMRKLDSTEGEINDLQDVMKDTQKFRNELLDKLNDMQDKLEREELNKLKIIVDDIGEK